MQIVFDTHRVRRLKERAAANFQQSDFLFEYAGKSFAERLHEINRNFDNAIYIGSRHGQTIKEQLLSSGRIDQLWTTDDIHFGNFICNLEALPFKEASLDLILSFMSLHQLNDLPGALIQTRRSLKPDGLLIGVMLGGETLYELRESFTAAELALYGGTSPHIHPFADKQQMGALMQRTGFALPVIDSDIISVSYPNICKLMHDIKNMGEGLALAQKNPRRYTKKFFDAVESYYFDNFQDKKDPSRVCASFEIIYLLGWSPHESQQKPLQPGTAQSRLSEALNTDEFAMKE